MTPFTPIDASAATGIDSDETLASSRYTSMAEWLVFAAFIGVSIATYFILTSGRQQQSLLTPALTAALLIANLVPSMALLVLFGRRIAKARAARTAIGSNGRLHVRLVALFSMIAAVPTLLVAIFASLLFQYGVDFWFSDSSRGMFENAASLAQGYKAENVALMEGNVEKMAGDLRDQLSREPITSPEFYNYMLWQTYSRGSSQSAIIEIGEDGVARTPAMVNPDGKPADYRVPPDVVSKLAAGAKSVPIITTDGFAAVTLLQPDSQVYLYLSRDSQMLGSGQLDKAQAVLADYNDLFSRSKRLQLQFNIALFLLSLMIVGIAVWIALAVADRLISPVLELVSASRRVADGDLSVRVPENSSKDEIGTLTSAFNRMTLQLNGQTSALLQANSQLESRRVFIETVLSGVSSGVMSLDQDRIIRLLNRSGERLLGAERAELIGVRLEDVAPELDEFVKRKDGEAVLQVSVDGDPRTLAAKTVHDLLGHVVTFEDITQQQLDQRRAAWSDVARRIAHEIKNPLTPIQLAAERLQRRYGETITGDASTFQKLTETIVRQVGDLRRMVDEFSSFARMPKPIFREENIVDLARQGMFLQEIAHPEIQFEVVASEAIQPLVCDRRQMAQLFTNIIKNAVEAIDHKSACNGDQSGGDNQIILTVDHVSSQELVISLSDTGAGLPKQRSAIVEPYMTTREGGTGLGLAIVKKIIEEHFGDISFEDRAGGGAVVRLKFNPLMLAPLWKETSDLEKVEGETVPVSLTRDV